MKVSDKLRACAKGGSAMGALGSTGTVDGNIERMFYTSELGLSSSVKMVADAIDSEESEVRRAAYEEGYNAAAADIDANQENEERELRDFCEKLNELADAREEVDLFGQAYVPLPLDADGNPIRVGDVMEFDSADGKKLRRVKAVGIDTFAGYEIDSTSGREIVSYNASVHHHKPETKEEVLREFAKKVAEILGGDDFLLDDNDELYKEYVKKLGDAE